MMRRIIRWVGVATLTVALGGGCAGLLSQNVGDGGNVDRVRLGTSSKWSNWDHSNAKKDDTCVMLKKELIF
jgi:hypothetical protein